MPAQPAHILTTNFNNPGYDTSSPSWARDVAGGQIWLENERPRYEWTQVLNPTDEFDRDLIGVSGWAVEQPELSESGGISSKDIPFTHPFGFDWEFFIATDPPYAWLLAPSNTGRDPVTGNVLPEGQEYEAATTHAAELGLSVPRGVLGVETDQDLVPQAYRLQDGDRVAVFGRWIVDCGHSDFHSEIHPPLLLVAARGIAKAGDPDRPRSGPLDVTVSNVIGRPYLVSQEFGDGALREHLIREVVKVFCPGFPLAALTGDCSTRVEAHPRIMAKPFSGYHLINYVVRPPLPRRSPGDRLIATFHFTVRTGVVVQLIGPGTTFSGPDAVGVLISINDIQYTAPPLPNRNDWNITIDELRQLNADAARIYNDVIIAAALAPLGPVPTNPVAALLLAQGIRTDRYASPIASSVHDAEITRIPAVDLRGNTPFSVDDRQPFPIYGFLRVEWERDLSVVAPPPRPAV